MYHILFVLHLSMDTWLASTMKFFIQFVNYLHRSEVRSVTRKNSKKAVFCLILFIPLFSFLKGTFLIKWIILPFFFFNPKKTFFPIQKIKCICVSPFLENGSILYYFSVSWFYHLMRALPLSFFLSLDYSLYHQFPINGHLSCLQSFALQNSPAKPMYCIGLFVFLLVSVQVRKMSLLDQKAW